jgi:hypothetical protein
MNFGNIDQLPASTAIKEFQLHVSNNHNNPWDITIKLLSPLTSGSYTIPNENFKYWGWGGTGTWDLGPGHLETSPAGPFYTPLPSQLMIDYTGLTLQFVVENIPAGQAAGLYTTSILVTMEDRATGEKIEQSVYVSIGIDSSLTGIPGI